MTEIVYSERTMNDMNNSFGDSFPSHDPHREPAVLLAEHADGTAGARPQPLIAATGRRPRRKRLPAILFLVTCVSTFFAGATGWLPLLYILNVDADGMRRAIIRNWQDGFIYMGCVLAILLTHEMGHFLATLRHRVPASLPFFLPLPISPIGTMGAVIAMDGAKADRKEMFDIGLAGPLAGLVVIIPVIWIGIQQIDWTAPSYGPFQLDMPLAVRLCLEQTRPLGYQAGADIAYSQLNPFLMAGWVGLLITGLNMLPVSQLDGGHVIYTLFGKRSHWIARGFMLLAVGYIVYARAPWWSIMVLLVLLMGIDHPPTRDDTVRLGWLRTSLGLLSLLIPVLCFPLHVLKTAGP
jgi:membrane-associated protease RseP (regulator of RpoE activity)